MTTKNLLSTRDLRPNWPPAVEEFLEQDGAVRLFSRMADPVAEPRATLVCTHGLGEHSNRYGHLAAAFVARGWRVVGWDLRGHGRSSGPRGDVAEYRWLTEDLGRICARYRAPGRPLFLFGHSLGGQITLRWLQTAGVSCQGAIIASPWLRLAFDPPWWRRAVARVALRCWPAFVHSTGSRLERLSRDLSHMMSLPDLDLVHHGISSRMYFAVRAAAAQVLAEAPSLHTPLFLLHGDADPVTSHHATCAFFEQVGSADKTLRIYPGSRHETHNDLDRELVIREMCDWSEARVAPRG